MPVTTIQRKKALAVGCTAHAIQDGLGAATYVLLPILAQTFGFGYAQVGLFNGVKNLSQALLELSSGIVSERIGAGRSLVFGLILSGLGYALLVFADQSLAVLTCLLVVGVGAAFQHAPASALVSEAYASGGRLGALGLYNSSGDVGKLAFAACFSVAIGAGLLWQQVALAYGLVALLAAFSIALATQVLSQPSDSVSGGKARENPDKRAREPSGWGVLDRRAFATLLTVITVDNMVQAGVLVFAAFAMIAKGLPLHIATFASVMVLVGGVFGKAGCGYLAQRLGVRNAFVLVKLVSMVGLVGVVLSPSWLAFGLLLPLGVVSQGSTSITYGLVPDLIHRDRLARGYALMYSLTGFAAAAGPFAFGVVADRFGINSAVLVMAVLSIFAAIPIIWLSPAAALSDRV